MPQSLAKVYIHIVFSTKYCKPIIKKEIQKDLHAYMVGTIANLKSYTNEIYANTDHVHILCNLPRTITLADFISKIKSSSSKWIKENGVLNFGWQNGYGVFSVSSSKIEIVAKYIRSQEEHHKKKSFKDELRAFFKEYGIDYDERYVWD
ncbi:transposase [Labilibaculum filiforme]|uniref:Transposase n=1 Tax=Labilibaculum filiforme TaxID=1940526 RepID=A0A2N3I2G9_9BACT|nr:IS200/IS605 family transposase [Labilibaculum filiforme]PKQ64492.1 transposase [Labilibaculum filiforme]